MHWRSIWRALQILCLAVVSSHGLSGCLDLTDTSDAGTGGTGSGSGTVLASTCTASFTPCGGDVTGSWAVQSICAQSSPAGAVNASDARFPDCANICSSAQLTASGSVTYASPTVTSSETFRLVESLAFSDACFSEATGTTLSDATCQSFNSDPSGTSSCALSLSTCACQFDQTTQDSATSYTLSGTEIVQYGSGALAQETIEYCVTGNTMTQQRQLPPAVNYLIQFTRQ